MSRQTRFFLVLALLSCSQSLQILADEPETIWLEAEHFVGISGYCWPMGDDARGMRNTDGNWGISGPGWAAEWNQGGESGFMSIATGAAESKAVVRRKIQVPRAGNYFVWVRYADWREASEQFEIHVRQPGAPDQKLEFGSSAKIEEDNEMKLYWGWAFAWVHAVANLKSGEAEIELAVSSAQSVPRQIDVVVLSTDARYRPLIKEQPASTTGQLLRQIQSERMPDWRPLARRNVLGEIDLSKPTDLKSDAVANWNMPETWRTKTFADRGFLYLWNVSHTDPLKTWLSDDPNRVLYPYNIIDSDTRTEFEAKYGGAIDVPIFSDPRVTPTFHGVGAGVFATDPTTGEVLPLGHKFSKWLDENPQRNWGMMMNYHPGVKIGDAGVAQFQKYRDRFVGSIAGESLGYFYPEAPDMKAATEAATTRRGLVSAFEPISLAANNAKYRALYDRDLDANPFADVISCHSVGSLAFAPICFRWGARTVGYESSAATSSLLSLRWACMRGAARQHGGLTATYRSCNFGDSSTIFSQGSSFSGPQNILDNYYSVYSGAGMTWYKFDIWYQYMAGSSMFYHEQGFDEFWKPGGTTAAGRKPVQLSPKGKLVDRFLRTTKEHPDRGSPVTPVAFLMDYAHGWEPANFWPNSFVNWQQQPDRFLHSDHEQMLQQWLWAAYYPIGPESEKPITAVNEVYVPGIFGDIFDCVFAYPEIDRWRTIDTYPVVVVLGDIELTDAEGQRLNQYVEQGGTLLVSADQLTGPGASQLQLPLSGERRQSDNYRWQWQSDHAKRNDCPVFEYQAIQVATSTDINAATTWQALATTESGDTFCAWSNRGAGRIVVLSVPRGLTVSRSLHPVSALLLAHLSRGQMPIEVDGDVQWLINRGKDAWFVTLLNPAGQAKPQQGITPTDYRQNKTVTIRASFPIHSATDWLAPDDVLAIDPTSDHQITLAVPAGSVRIIELR